jgi:hypothetical protein
MIRVKSNTGKVHVKQGETGTLCNGWSDYSYSSYQRTDEPVTCKHCLKISKRQSPVTAKSFLSDSEKQISVKVFFGSKVNSVQTFFETKAEKAAYIKGVRDALLKMRASYITINGEKI